MKVQIRKLFVVLFFFSLSFIPLGQGEMRVGFNTHYLTIEESETKCLDATLRRSLLSLGEHFSKFIISLREAYPALVEGESTKEELVAVTKELQKKIIEYYNENEEIPELGGKIPGYPSPSSFYQDTVYEKLFPSAVYITLSKRIQRKQKAEAKVNKMTEVQRMLQSKGMSAIKLGTSVQAGLLFAPTCQYVQDIYGNGELKNGTLIEGWLGGEGAWIGRLNISPIIIIYSRAGTQSSRALDEKGVFAKILRSRLSYGQIWGNFNSLNQIYGQLVGLSYNMSFRSSSLLPSFGINGKVGCILNWARQGSLSIPFCDDFIYKSWRLDPYVDENSSNPRIRFNSSFSIDFLGLVFSGRRALDTLAFITGTPQESVDKFLSNLKNSSWDFFFMEEGDNKKKEAQIDFEKQ